METNSTLVITETYSTPVIMETYSTLVIRCVKMYEK